MMDKKLKAAIEANNLKLVKQLYLKGVDFTEKDEYGFPYSFYCRSEEMLRYVIGRFSPFIIENEMHSCLSFMVTRAPVGAIKYLIEEEGVEIDDFTVGYAVNQYRLDMVEYFKSKGIDTDAAHKKYIKEMSEMY